MEAMGIRDQAGARQEGCSDIKTLQNILRRANPRNSDEVFELLFETLRGVNIRIEGGYVPKKKPRGRNAPHRDNTQPREQGLALGPSRVDPVQILREAGVLKRNPKKAKYIPKGPLRIAEAKAEEIRAQIASGAINVEELMSPTNNSTNEPSDATTEKTTASDAELAQECEEPSRDEAAEPVNDSESEASEADATTQETKNEKDAQAETKSAEMLEHPRAPSVSPQNTRNVRGCFSTSAGPYRVLLSADKQRGDFNLPLVRMANGLVLDSTNWDIVSMPACGFTPKYRTVDIRKNFDQYKVYKIIDGTVVTLYWYAPQNRWCMSSVNGYDVSTYRWMGPDTFMEEFLRVVSAHHPGWSLELLDRNVCYTVGFRSHHFHPMVSDPEQTWLICAHDLTEVNAGNYTQLNLESDPRVVKIGIAPQKTAKIDTPNKRHRIKWMQERNDKALEDYKNKRCHYGYILRGGSGAFSNIIMKSSLLNKVGRLMYNTPKHAHNGSIPIDWRTRLRYTSLSSYLQYDRRMYAELFPSVASEHYPGYHLMLDTILDYISRLDRADPTLNEEQIPSGLVKRGDVTAPISHAQALKLARIFAEKRREVVNSDSPQGDQILADYVRDPCFTDLYFNEIASTEIAQLGAETLKKCASAMSLNAAHDAHATKKASWCDVMDEEDDEAPARPQRHPSDKPARAHHASHLAPSRGRGASRGSPPRGHANSGARGRRGAARGSA
jgi:hypothetical protein